MDRFVVKKVISYCFFLYLVSYIAAGIFAKANKLGTVKAREVILNQAILNEVMPDASKFSAVKGQEDKILFYRAFDNKNKLIGYVFKASSKGYSSVIETLAGVFLDHRISAIKVISQNETPGLGLRITEEKFREQFKDQDSLDLSSVQAISGATISSRAVIDSVQEKAKEINALLKNEE